MCARSADERRESRAEWRRRWRAVPYPDQRRVRDALQRGGAVDDSRLAPVAVEAAEHRLRGEEGFGYPHHQSAIGALQAALGLALLIDALVGGDVFEVVIGGAMIAIGGGQIATWRLERHRLRRAAAANRALAGEPRYPPEET